MMVGKRARGRHPMKRTTSMTEFSFEDLTLNNNQPDHDQFPVAAVDIYADHKNYNQRVMALVSPRPRTVNRRQSADFAIHSAAPPVTFLTTCSLCTRRLPPGRDIYMYRGDSGFCSPECRQEQMAEDEGKEKEKEILAKEKEKESKPSNAHSHSHSRSSPAGSRVVSSANAETVAAL